MGSEGYDGVSESFIGNERSSDQKHSVLPQPALTEGVRLSSSLLQYLNQELRTTQQVSQNVYSIYSSSVQ